MKTKAKTMQILVLGCALTSVGDIAACAGAIFQTSIGKDGLA
jgi:hypothetical protein